MILSVDSNDYAARSPESDAMVCPWSEGPIAIEKAGNIVRLGSAREARCLAFELLREAMRLELAGQ